MEAVAAEYGYSKMEDLHAALGYGKYSARQVLQKLAPDQIPATWSPCRNRRARATPSIRRARRSGPGHQGQRHRRSAGVSRQVLQSDRGEAIVGYVTRGKGVAVHSLNCANVQNLMYEVERKIDVEWARSEPPSRSR